MKKKYVDLEQRNNFKVGDKVEFCQPKGELVEAVIEKMTDEDGNPIDVAPHAQMEGSFVYGYKIGTIFHDAPRVQGESRVTWYMKILLLCQCLMK